MDREKYIGNIPTVLVAADHRGRNLQNELVEAFSGMGNINIIEVGNNDEEVVDYPEQAKILALKMKQQANYADADTLAATVISEQLRSSKIYGVLICGTGNGVSIAANRFPWLRCIVGHDVDNVKLGRQHNDINVLALGADHTSCADAILMVRAMLDTAFSLELRHRRRVNKLSEMKINGGDE